MIMMPLAEALRTSHTPNVEDNIFEAMLKKIRSREATVAVVGMGYVGLPLAHAFLKQGFPLIGFDIDSRKLKTLSLGRSPYAHFQDEHVAEMLQTERITFADDPKVLQQADAIIMCIPTPINKYDEPDLAPLIAATRTVVSQLRAGQLVCLESTTYPGTTEEVLAPMLEASGYRLGHEVFLAYSPEREDPGNKHFSVSQIPKVCSGLTGKCGELAQALYGSVVNRVIMVSNPRVAEMTKLVENVQRWVNIGLMNELKMVADAFGIDLFDVVDAASTKPFGFVPYYPGPGVGGHCIPVDPHYLEWKAKEKGVATHFIQLAKTINHTMPMYVVNKLVSALNEKGKSLNGSRILVLGISYKPDIDDTRESPSLEVLEILCRKKAQVEFYDPFVMEQQLLDGTPIPRARFERDALREFDATLILTNHSSIDYRLLSECAPLIVDTRGVFRNLQCNIIRA